MSEPLLPFPADIGFALRSLHRDGGDPAAGLLPAERRLLGPRAVPKRVAEFAGGRAAAREALAHLGVTGAAALAIGRAGRAPCWPAGVVGALTHAGAWAAAAVARSAGYAGIGLDLEQVRAVSEAVIGRVALPAERQWLDGLPPALRAEGFALLFSAKESVYKALNPATGVYLGYREGCIALEAGALREAAGGAFRWRLEVPCGPYPAGFGGQGWWHRLEDGGGAGERSGRPPPAGAPGGVTGSHVLTALWVRRGAVPEGAGRPHRAGTR